MFHRIKKQKSVPAVPPRPIFVALAFRMMIERHDSTFMWVGLILLDSRYNNHRDAPHVVPDQSMVDVIATYHQPHSFWWLQIGLTFDVPILAKKPPRIIVMVSLLYLVLSFSWIMNTWTLETHSLRAPMMPSLVTAPTTLNYGRIQVLLIVSLLFPVGLETFAAPFSAFLYWIRIHLWNCYSCYDFNIIMGL